MGPGADDSGVDSEKTRSVAPAANNRTTRSGGRRISVSSEVLQRGDVFVYRRKKRVRRQCGAQGIGHLCESFTTRARGDTRSHSGTLSHMGENGPQPCAQSLTWRRTPPKKISQHRRGARLRRDGRRPSQWQPRAAESSAA